MISIIVPVYNIKSYVGRCIESVLAQTYNDWELILVDDGSFDGSERILDEYGSRDSRIRVFHQENGGVSSARNFGLDNACGEFISFIDGDDWIEPTLYEDAMNKIDEYNVDVFMFELYIDRNGISKRRFIDKNAYGPISVEDCLIHSITPHNRYACSKVFSSKLLMNKHGLPGQIRFDTNIILGEDSLFIIQALANAHAVYYSENAYYHYDQREGSAVRSTFNQKKLSGLDAYTKILSIFKRNGYSEAYVAGCGALMNLGVQLGRRAIEGGQKNSEVIRIIQSAIAPVRKTVLFSKQTDCSTKLKAFLSWLSLPLTCKLLSKRRRKW